MEGLDVGLVVLDTGSREGSQEGAIDGLDVGCIILGLKEGSPDCAIDGCQWISLWVSQRVSQRVSWLVSQMLRLMV